MNNLTDLFWRIGLEFVPLRRRTFDKLTPFGYNRPEGGDSESGCYRYGA